MNFDRNNVMLTSQKTFTPEVYQCIGFSKTHRRTVFLDRCRSAAFVAVYLTKDSPDERAGHVVGVGQINDQLGSMRDFTPLAGQNSDYARVAADWPFAVGYARAWKATKPMKIEDFAPQTYIPPIKTARDIGAHGRLLTPGEADKLALLGLEEVMMQR